MCDRSMYKRDTETLTGILSGYFSLILAASALLFSEDLENRIIRSKQGFDFEDQTVKQEQSSNPNLSHALA